MAVEKKVTLEKYPFGSGQVQMEPNTSIDHYQYQCDGHIWTAILIKKNNLEESKKIMHELGYQFTILSGKGQKLCGSDNEVAINYNTGKNHVLMIFDIELEL